MARRQKLVWFALGAFTSALFFLLTTALLSPTLVLDDSSTDYLVLQEPPADPQGVGSVDASLTANQAGELLRECGVQYFETNRSSNRRSATAEMPLIPQNVQSIPCVVSRAMEEGIEVTTVSHWGDADDLADEIAKSTSIP